MEHLLIGHYSARYKDFDQFENEAQEVLNSLSAHVSCMLIR